MEEEAGWGSGVEQEVPNLWSLHVVQEEELGASCTYRRDVLSLGLCLSLSQDQPSQSEGV